VAGNVQFGGERVAATYQSQGQEHFYRVLVNSLYEKVGQISNDNTEDDASDRFPKEQAGDVGELDRTSLGGNSDQN